MATAKYFFDDNVLIAYLDLCGTKFAYSRLPLAQQVERIGHVISRAIEGLDNGFGGEKKSLYVHMFADSLVVAERTPIENCAGKFVCWLLKFQYDVLQNSVSLELPGERALSEQKRYMPILSRAIVRRGQYFGLLFEEHQNSIDEILFNPSLIGGSSLLEMDADLKGLPMGTYIDVSILRECKIEEKRLIDVEASQLKFIKPLLGFDSLRSLFPAGAPENFADWISQLIEMTEDSKDFFNKLKPWADAVQGRLQSIKRHT